MKKIMKRMGLVMMVAGLVATLASTFGQMQSDNGEGGFQFLWWLLLPTYLMGVLCWVLLRSGSVFSNIPLIAVALAVIVAGSSLIAAIHGGLQAVYTWLNGMAIGTIIFFFGLSYYLESFRQKEK